MEHPIEFSGPLTSSLLAIEVPAYVQEKPESVDKMIRALGEYPSLIKSSNDPKTLLELKFRDSDPFCHPIFAHHTKTSNLLLKLSKSRKRKDRNDEEAIEGTLVGGVIENTFSFKALSDFQYLSSTTSQKEPLLEFGNEVMEREKIEQKLEKMDLPPPIFSKIDIPQDYGFRANTLFKIEEEESTHVKKVKRGLSSGKFPIRIAQHNDVSVPAADPSIVCDSEVESEVQKLFESRSIWSKTALSEAVKLPWKNISKFIAKFAYYFNDGPWRKLYIKLGYDPRLHPESKKWQIVDLRLKGTAVQKLIVSRNPRRKKETVLDMSKLHSDTSTPSETGEGEGILSKPHQQQQTLYQICDLNDRQIKALVASDESTSDTCTKIYGWMTKKCMTSIQSILKQKFTSGDKYKDSNAMDEDIVSDTAEEAQQQKGVAVPSDKAEEKEEEEEVAEEAEQELEEEHDESEDSVDEFPLLDDEVEESEDDE